MFEDRSTVSSVQIDCDYLELLKSLSSAEFSQIYTSSFTSSVEESFVRSNSISIDSISSSTQAASRTIDVFLEKESEFNKRAHTENRSQSFASDIVTASLIQFSTTDERFKKKEQKRVEKKSKMMSLIDMLDDITEIFDKSLSIRQFLKQNRVDISLMN